MVTSTGTFVSCKDYDDDIENLQGQIDTVVKDLADLKALIGDKGVTSVTFDEKTGVLTVVDGTGTKTYTIKTTAPDVEEVNIKIDGKNLVVNGTVIGEVGDKVTMEDGQLFVNGVATGLKVGQYAILNNQNANSVTITLPDANGKMQTVTLMTTAASLSSVEFEDNSDFDGFTYGNNSDIQWMKSLKANPDWKGSKGAVEKNQLLIAQIKPIAVQVTPADYKLDEQTVGLYDSRKNPAPVKITPVANNLLMSRASSANGSWLLFAEIDQSKVNANNIDEAFAFEDNSGYMGYALCVSGNPVTTYDISVRTNKESATYNGYVKPSDLNFVDKNGRVQDTGEKLPAGTTTEFYIDNAYLYDFYLTFEDTNQSLAKKYGIKPTANGRGLEIPAGAEGVKITVTVHTMAINGNVAPSIEAGQDVNRIDLVIAGSEVAAETLETQKHVISAADPLKAIEIDFAGVFEKFPAAALEAVRSGNAYLVVEDDENNEGFFIESIEENNVKYIDAVTSPYTNTGDRNVVELFKAGEDKAWEFDKDDMIDLKKMKLNVTAINPKATPGTYNLVFKAIEKNNGTEIAGNELVKVIVPVEISTPTFADLFDYTGNWNEAKDVYTTKISITDGLQPALLMADAFTQKATTGALDSKIQLLFNLIEEKAPILGGTEIVTDGVKYTYSAIDTKMVLDQDLIYNDKNDGLKHSELNVQAFYDLLDAAGVRTTTEVHEAFAVKSGAITVKLQKALEGITAAYYVKGAAVNSVQLLEGNEIKAGAGTIGKDAEGFFFSLDGKALSVALSSWYKLVNNGTADAPQWGIDTYADAELGSYRVVSTGELEKPFAKIDQPVKANEIGVQFVDEKNNLTYEWDNITGANSTYTNNMIVNGWRGNLGSTNLQITFYDATGMKYIMNPITLKKAIEE